MGKTRKASNVLTLDEAAGYWKVSPDAVARQAGLGLIPGRLIEGEWRFSQSALEKWLRVERLEQPNIFRRNEPPSAPESRHALLAQAGRLAHDPQLLSMLDEIYALRNRPEVDREPS